jgi:hypothetical protein
MSKALTNRVSKSWFSNYDEELALSIHCGACEQWTPVRVRWQELRTGTGGVDLSANAQASPFVLTRHALVSCNCGAQVVLALTGGAGGRQGEEQYGVAGLRTGDVLFK